MTVQHKEVMTCNVCGHEIPNSAPDPIRIAIMNARHGGPGRKVQVSPELAGLLRHWRLLEADTADELEKAAQWDGVLGLHNGDGSWTSARFDLCDGCASRPLPPIIARPAPETFTGGTVGDRIDAGLDQLERNCARRQLAMLTPWIAADRKLAESRDETAKAFKGVRSKVDAARLAQHRGDAIGACQLLLEALDEEIDLTGDSQATAPLFNALCATQGWDEERVHSDWLDLRTLPDGRIVYDVGR